MKMLHNVLDKNYKFNMIYQIYNVNIKKEKVQQVLKIC